MTARANAVNVRRTVALASLALAWLCANGAIWDLAQVFAWTRMFAGYAESRSVGAALRETFDASKPCELCRAISQAKESHQQQSSPQVEPNSEKLILALELPAPVFLSSPPAEWPAARWTLLDPRVEPVPVPPPRA